MLKKIYSLTFCLCLVVGLLTGCAAGGDVGLAQNGVNKLINGDQAAADFIEWDTFQFMGKMAGSEYVVLPDEAQKAAFRTSFVTSAAATFQGMHASTDTFSNWRIREEDATKTVVVADTHHEGKLLVTVLKRSGNPKIWSISIGL